MERQEKIAETTTLLLQQLSLAVCLLLITSLGIAGPSSTPQQDFSAAATLIKQKDYPAAINRFKEGLSKAEKGTSISEKDLIGVKFGLSTAYLLSGNMQPIGSLILPLLPDIKKLYGEVSIENATAHQMLAYAYQLSGDFQKSAYFFNQLVGLYEKMPAIPYAQRVQVLSLKADVHRQSGDYLQAIESEKRLLTVYKNHQPVDQLAIATLYGQLAALSEQLGDKDTALDYYHLQYDTVVLANGEQSPLAQSIAQNIATREEQKRDRLAGDDRSLVGALSLSAIDLSGNIGFPDSMEKIYTSTRATFGEKHPLTLNVMSKYADSLALGFKTNKAIAVYEKIIAIKQQQGAPDNDAMAGLYLRAAQAHQARIMFEDGAAHHEAALRDAHRAIKIYTDLYGDAHLRSLIALNLLWQIQRFDQTRKDENIALALRCWDAYIKLEHKILPFMSGPQRIAFRQAFAQLQDNLIETAWLITRSSAFKDAQGNDLYFPPTKIPELNLDDVPPEKHQQAMDQWIQQLKAQNESNENTLKTHNASVQKLTKAIYARWINYKGSVNAIDYELNEAKRDPHNNPHLGLITQLLDLRKRQALLATRASPEEKDDLRAVSQRITALTQKVVKRVPSLVINASLQTDDLVKSLPKKTVFIDFARYSNSEYMAFITEPSGKLTIRRLTGGLEGGDAINTGITKIRQDINAIIDGTLPFEGSAKRLDKELAKLNDALVYPMRNILAQYDTAVFSPDGLLSLIPFGLLRNQKTGKYLIE